MISNLPVPKTYMYSIAQSGLSKDKITTLTIDSYNGNACIISSGTDVASYYACTIVYITN